MEPKCLWPVLLLLLVLSQGCVHSSRPALFRGQDSLLLTGHADDEFVQVFIVGHGWHTGLVVRQTDVHPEIWPESTDFADQTYIEVGWGDAGLYPAEEMTAQLLLSAAFIPTRSVLHVVGFDQPVPEFFPQSDIVEIYLTRSEFDRLCHFIQNSYELDRSGKAIRTGSGIYGRSHFYAARGRYFFPKTCNVWTAQALKTAGLPISPEFSASAIGVLRQSRPYGTELRGTPLLRRLERSLWNRRARPETAAPNESVSEAFWIQ